MIGTEDSTLMRTVGVPPKLAKRRLERARRRPRNRPRSDAYLENLRVWTWAWAQTSKYDPAECRRNGKR